MNVEEAIATKLKADAGVSAIVGVRVWQLKWPQTPTLPAVMVQLVDEVGDNHLHGDVGMTQARVQVDAYGKESGVADPYGAVVDLAFAVYTALVGIAPFSVGDRRVLSVKWLMRRTLFEAAEIRAVRVTQDFEVFSEPV